MRFVSIDVIGLLALSIVPRGAAAQAFEVVPATDPVPDEGVTGAALAMMTYAVPAGALGLTFLIADLVYAGEGRVMPYGWSVSELFAGLMQEGAGIASLVIMDEYDVHPISVAIAAASFGMGTFHIIHALVSMVENQRAAEELPPVALTPRADGVELHLRWRM